MGLCHFVKVRYGSSMPSDLYLIPNIPDAQHHRKPRFAMKRISSRQNLLSGPSKCLLREA